MIGSVVIVDLRRCEDAENWTVFKGCLKDVEVLEKERILVWIWRAKCKREKMTKRFAEKQKGRIKGS